MNQKEKYIEAYLSIDKYIDTIESLREAILFSFSEDVWSKESQKRFDEALKNAEQVCPIEDEDIAIEHSLNEDGVRDNDVEDVAQKSLFDEPDPLENISDEIRNDLPFDLPDLKQQEEKVQEDVQNGLLDEGTATEFLNELHNQTSAYYRYDNGAVYVLKPEEMSVDITARQFFANFLSQEYSQNLTEINVDDMIIDYDNHVFKKLTWTNKYGVTFSLDLVKYLNFIEKYVLQ